jgi:hypothetical protein
MEQPAWQWQEQQIHVVELEQRLKLGAQAVELGVELLVLQPGCLMAEKTRVKRSIMPVLLRMY